jgi:hypothetical protein
MLHETTTSKLALGHGSASLRHWIEPREEGVRVLGAQPHQQLARSAAYVQHPSAGTHRHAPQCFPRGGFDVEGPFLVVMLSGLRVLRNDWIGFHRA